MSTVHWWLVDKLSRALEADERDAVCGDLVESNETGARALLNVLSLVVRRQAALWQDWRPWVAFVVIVAPLGVLLSVSSRLMAHGTAIPIWMYLDNWTAVYLESAAARGDLARISADVLNQYLLLGCWSWASGFLLGSFSRRTIQVNGLLFCLAVLLASLVQAPRPDAASIHAPVFSLTFYSTMFPLIVQTALVLLPAFLGARQGFQLATTPTQLRAVVLACAVVTAMTFAIRNWGWILCSAGEFRACMDWALEAGYARQAGAPVQRQIPTLPLTLVGPVGYLIATVGWRRLRGLAAPLPMIALFMSALAPACAGGAFR